MLELNYITTKTAAQNWNISQRRVLALCAEDRIDGLARVENIWLIPKDASKPIDARSVRHIECSSSSARPFVKWVGGKGQLIETIRANLPSGLGTSIRKYAEPFVGGGAVLFDILRKYSFKEVYISDTNEELINTYQTIRDNVEALISELAKMQQGYLPLDDAARKDYYYEKRERYNELVSRKETTGLEIAALFIFLNRTCFNGLYRVNSHGHFNVPMGAYKNPQICDAENLRNVSSALQNVTIVCGDYQKAADFIDSETFVYIDPPYRPLTETAMFTSYTENGFTDQAQIGLAQFVDEMSERGAKLLVSNSDPHNTNPEDDFFDNLYAKHHIQRVSAIRAINSNKDKRGKITELLISTYDRG